MRDLQLEHAEWLRRNYPEQTPEFPAAGCVEEAGELMHALLKCQQAGVWGPEARYAGTDWSAKIVDAVGDCAIYACSLCNTCGWDFASLVARARSDADFQPPLTAFQAAAELVRLACDVAKRPERCEMLCAYLTQLVKLCADWGHDFEPCVRATWDRVKLRGKHAAERR